ncbi:MAG TPA: HAMP domain-containing sensor histidine kinase [Vicinamibacterales bacterium]
MASSLLVRPSPPALARRTLLSIALVGVASALVVFVAGWAVGRSVIGVDNQQARTLVEREVHGAFDTMSRKLRDVSASLADPAAVRAASDGDTAAANELMTRANQSVTRNDPDATVTVYGADSMPLAWAGRPTEMPPDRLTGGETWFIAPGARGLRLFYIRPVVDRPTRVGTIVVEQALPAAEESDGRRSRLQGADADSFRFSTPLAPVSVQLPVERIDRLSSRAFEVRAPSGAPLLTAMVSDDDLTATRERWGRATVSLALMVLGLTVMLLTGPLLDWRNRQRHAWPYALVVALIAVVIMTARLLFSIASPADWSTALVFSSGYASSLLTPLLKSPFDFLLTAGTACALAALLLAAAEAARAHFWRHRRSVSGARNRVLFLAEQLAAGAIVAVILLGHQALLRDTVSHNTTLDLLHFSLHPWNMPRLALQLGLVLAHAAALGLGVLVLRASLVGWRVPRRTWSMRALTLAAWTLPLIVWQLTRRTAVAPQLPLLVALVATVMLAGAATRLGQRYRRGSQAFRLSLLTLPLVIPAFAFYPTIVQFARQAKSDLVVSTYAPEVTTQRQEVQTQVKLSRSEIDAFPNLVDLVTTKINPGVETSTDRAFRVWQTTALARYPITSSVELYGADGRLVSRFAFNLPEDLSTTPLSAERSCDWDVFEEVAPFFAEERRVLHAGRAFCAADPKAPPLGSIVVHAMPDFENLTFISSRSPYMELVRPIDPLRDEGLAGRDVEFAVYGWSRTQLYPLAATAWSLPDDVFERVEASRTPFWTTLYRGRDAYDVYLLNDRGGIYALGYPSISALGHLVNLAELAVLALCMYVLLLVANALHRWLGRRRVRAAALLREIRASFYRKLFLAFVAAAFVPVIALVVVTRNYVADQVERSIEQEAVRTASTAARVVEDLASRRAAQQGVGVDDDLMVLVGRLIDQDVNMFMGPRLQATSERNLFASGFLPTRTPSEVYRALELGNEASYVTHERIGASEYLVAATRLTLHQLGILTVPLTSRQREIEEQIDTLDRRALLAALLFILGGAGLGYSMAERISDPVSRLTRATRRIARGDLEARVAATSSDELRRLVDDFNSMASDLQRQRTELERTHRLEAWAEMARQVAHEIKNPLTPIQLNAEHLRRVHADRGEPLGPVLQECVGTILTQVKLLRQIASEFSSYASSPTAKPADVDSAALLREIVEPYRVGLEGRIHFDVDVPVTLPHVRVDRTLIARSLTNIVENALHAMPGSGTLGVSAHHEDHVVHIRVSDTGVGMDREALARAFEPYFSTKASGTGLGLPIAKRNVELSGGTITIVSERERGTTVAITLPIAG